VKEEAKLYSRSSQTSSFTVFTIFFFTKKYITAETWSLDAASQYLYTDSGLKGSVTGSLQTRKVRIVAG
jgi:hypothetical protein